MTQHCDTWHQLEAADERAWLDAWARAQVAIDQTDDYHPVIIAPRPVGVPAGITR